MQATKKQVGLLLIILIIPAFLFIFFQLSFKNYYKLPYINVNGESKAQPLSLNNSLYQIPQNRIFWVVGYGEDNQKSEQLYNILMPLAQNEDMKTLLKTKLPDYQIKYLLLSKNFQKVNNHIVLDTTVNNAKNIGMDWKNDVLIIDNKGFIRGKYQILSQGNDERERLYVELKVLIEIVSSGEGNKK
ncbi:hypothetical protein AD998_14225 [bacterium 336/3]|nr:hypothetical protein AD998_14225 [bacterium 336/3]